MFKLSLGEFIVKTQKNGKFYNMTDLSWYIIKI